MNLIPPQGSIETPEPGLFQTVVVVWPLLFGICLLMLGNGLQGTLLGLRAELEGFDRASTGLIMASFFAGFLAGSLWTPKALGMVGHIRVFAALSAVASVSILTHVMIIETVSWSIIRFLTGFCYAGIFIIAESWLNDRVPKATRGQLLAVYMAVSFGGMGGGQFLLTVADPMGTRLFIVVSILISLSVVPMLLQTRPSPTFEHHKPISMKDLYRSSPLGVVGVFVAGVSNGTLFGMGAVYASSVGFTIPQTAAFMGAMIVGAAVLQYPIGRLSDLIDRRKVILAVAVLASLLAILAGPRIVDGSWATLFIAAAVGGAALSIHSLSVAYSNDYLANDEMVAASSGLVLILGIGSILGPLASGLVLGLVGPPGFFYWLAATNGLLAVFAVWRMNQRDVIPAEEQAPYVGVPLQASEIAVTVAEEVALEAEAENAAES